MSRELCSFCLQVSLEVMFDENEQPYCKCHNCGYPDVRPDYQGTSGIEALRAAEHLMGEPITP